MEIELGTTRCVFFPWKPTHGTVFSAPFAFDCETTRIDDEREWVTPAYVLGAAFDGSRGYFIPRDRVAAFLEAHRRIPMVLHNASFDLAVLKQVGGDVDVYEMVDRSYCCDTQLLHRLYVLGTQGHPASGRGESTLEYCAAHYLGIQLPKDILDSEGNPVRLSYDRWLNRAPEQIEPIYLSYLATDVIVTLRLFENLRRRLKSLLTTSRRFWGYASDK